LDYIMFGRQRRKLFFFGKLLADGKFADLRLKNLKARKNR